MLNTIFEESVFDLNKEMMELEDIIQAIELFCRGIIDCDYKKFFKYFIQTRNQLL
ncbi:MAG: hypothetical protein HeimAB125_23710 [Candidatus Heimdallarchaeota archaeon AB_125]|nr:MAG: hypothetical protein HeimAB125_23710 [Candidatus Heimdallarchaeota archaeon AB_125]